MAYPPELAFLNEVFADPTEKYARADWLLNDFTAPVWQYSFGYKKPKELNWDVRIDDGNSLLDKCNSQLLNGFRYWLTINTRPDAGAGACSNALSTQKSNFFCNIKLIDYLLLNSNQYKLSEAALAGLNTDELKAILDKIASSNDPYESLFEWSDRLSLYLLSEIRKTAQPLIDQVLNKHPEITIITTEQKDNNTLSIDIGLVPSARAVLFIKGFYRPYEGGYTPNSLFLSRLLFHNTIYIKEEAKPTSAILEYKRCDAHYGREFTNAPASKQNMRVFAGTYYNYRRALYNLGGLHLIGIPAPSIVDIRSIEGFQSEMSKSGHHLTLPSQVVFDAVKNAIEFHLKHGKDLVDSYCRLALRAKRLGCPLTSLTNEDFALAINPSLRAIGVNKFGISGYRIGLKNSVSRQANANQHFSQFRGNHGLVELIAVYFGCVQLALGVLMARRQGEMIDLMAGECLDNSMTWLLFKNRKSTRGMLGLRNTEARPIEPIVVEMIQQLERMQRILKRIGVIDELTNLFAAPSLSGSLVLTLSPDVYNRCLDFFCDYFETPLNSKGERYYIRQHQLRRFFAMLFFYSSSFGGLETLQWMMGHTDPIHVWHYITETISGEVLRSAKAQFVAENLHRYDAQDYKELAELIKARFGTDDFSLVETDELEEHILDLMEEGQIEIEPEFFDDENGQQMRVMVKVRELT